MRIDKGDKGFLMTQALPYFGILKVLLRTDLSKARWPDIWCTPYADPPVITVTETWRRKPLHSRRSELVHELLHLKGLEHGVYHGLVYSTLPHLDTYSKAVYRRILNA